MECKKKVIAKKFEIQFSTEPRYDSKKCGDLE